MMTCCNLTILLTCHLGSILLFPQQSLKGMLCNGPYAITLHLKHILNFSVFYFFATKSILFTYAALLSLNREKKMTSTSHATTAQSLELPLSLPKKVCLRRTVL